MTHSPPSEESAQEETLKELRAWCEEHQLNTEVYVARARGLVTSERDLDTAVRLIIEYSPLPKERYPGNAGKAPKGHRIRGLQWK